MRTIKFHGKSKYSGDIIFGDLIHVDENIYIENEPVYPESVAQLVGYDADGNEVYEGDQLIRLDGVIGFLAPDVVTNYPDYKLAR